MPREEPVRYEMALLRTARAIRHAFNARLKETGLGVTAATLVTFLVEDGPMTQRELAERGEISAASAGTVVDELVTRGLVVRHDDPADRRVWRVVPTAAAVPYAEAFRRIDREVQAELRRGLSRAERAELKRLLARLEHNASAASERTSQPAGGR